MRGGRAQDFYVTVACVALAVATNGYSFLQGDQAIHLVFVGRELDSQFLSGDLLAETARHHPSFFWNVMALLSGWLPIESLYFLIHCVSLFAMCAGTMCLARAIFAQSPDRRTIGWVATAFAAIGTGTFAEIPSFDPLVVNRNVVIGIELFAIALATRGRPLAAAAVCGLAFNFHATTALHALLLVLAASVFSRKKRGSILWVVGLVALGFAILALPLGWEIAALQLEPPPGGTLGGDAWRATVAFAFPFHHFLSTMTSAQWLWLTLPTLAVLVSNKFAQNPPLMSLFGACLVGIAATYVLTELCGLSSLLSLHGYEVSRFLTYLGFVALAHVLVALSKHRRGLLLGAATAASYAAAGMMSADVVRDFMINPFWICSLFTAAALVGLLVLRTPTAAGTAEESRSVWPVLGGVFLALAATARLGELSAFRFSLDDVDRAQVSQCLELWNVQQLDRAALPSRRDLCGRPVMAWSRENLPDSANIVMPPYSTHPLTFFRFVAKRRVFANFRDGGEATFSPAYAYEWSRRMSALAGKSVLKPPVATTWMSHVERYLSFGRSVESNFATPFFHELASKFGVTHVLLPRYLRDQVDLRVIYEDTAYVLFAIE